MGPDARPERPQRRPPRLADMVAGELRDEILSGAIADGDLLPKQDELIERFRVSPPSVREALRILETEGLVTVLRGNVGGARVRRPRSERVGYMAAMVLQSRKVRLHDVLDALRHLEALCVELAAERADRDQNVVPILERRLDEHRRSIDDTPAYIRSARAFHEDLVDACGNESLRLTVGALEAMWSAHVEDQASPASGRPYDSIEFRRTSLAEHEALTAAIAAGDATEAVARLRAHLDRPGLGERERWLDSFVRQPVRAAVVATD